MKWTFTYIIAITAAFLLTVPLNAQRTDLPLLKVSSNKRFFQTLDGKPFFWLGDTGWLLFVKCTREEVMQYLDIRKEQGFNVIQVMLLHDVKSAKNVYGDSALIRSNVARPATTTGSDFFNSEEYDYWDHVDFVIEEAAKRGIYMALVPVWGSNVKAGHVTRQQAIAYANFLAARYKKSNNIIWLNGGDLKGTDSPEVWKAIGTTLKKQDPHHLVTFHPRGRYSSSEWFHKESWLDFNMFQSGHRNYAQDTSSSEKNHYGEDNWKYARGDYALSPAKPTMDGEPSYENIPHGLHDGTLPRWAAPDLRRYAYWSVFAGSAGFTYGENSVMQFHRVGDADSNYGVKLNWKEAVHATGATEMKYLKELVLSKPYFERIPDQSLVINAGDKYNNLLATRGKNYAFIYTYTGRPIKVRMGKVGGTTIRAKWFDPRTGKYTPAGEFKNTGIKEFDPPGEEKEGNDWILVLE